MKILSLLNIKKSQRSMKEKIQGEENHCHYAELTCAEER